MVGRVLKFSGEAYFQDIPILQSIMLGLFKFWVRVDTSTITQTLDGFGINHTHSIHVWYIYPIHLPVLTFKNNQMQVNIHIPYMDAMGNTSPLHFTLRIGVLRFPMVGRLFEKSRMERMMLKNWVWSWNNGNFMRWSLRRHHVRKTWILLLCLVVIFVYGFENMVNQH